MAASPGKDDVDVVVDVERRRAASLGKADVDVIVDVKRRLGASSRTKADPAMEVPLPRIDCGVGLWRRAQVFHYENWDVYRAALRLRDIADQLSEQLPRGHGSDLRHLREAASSVVMNLSEGALQRTPGRAAEAYGVARGSASECYGALLIPSRPAGKNPLIAEGKHECTRISAMITNMIRKKEGE